MLSGLIRFSHYFYYFFHTIQILIDITVFIFNILSQLYIYNLLKIIGYLCIISSKYINLLNLKQKYKGYNLIKHRIIYNIKFY